MGFVIGVMGQVSYEWGAGSLRRCEWHFGWWGASKERRAWCLWCDEDSVYYAGPSLVNLKHKQSAIINVILRHKSPIIRDISRDVPKNHPPASDPQETIRTPMGRAFSNYITIIPFTHQSANRAPAVLCSSVHSEPGTTSFRTHCLYQHHPTYAPAICQIYLAAPHPYTMASQSY